MKLPRDVCKKNESNPCDVCKVPKCSTALSVQYIFLFFFQKVPKRERSLSAIIQYFNKNDLRKKITSKKQTSDIYGTPEVPECKTILKCSTGGNRN